MTIMPQKFAFCQWVHPAPGAVEFGADLCNSGCRCTAQGWPIRGSSFCCTAQGWPMHGSGCRYTAQGWPVARLRLPLHGSGRPVQAGHRVGPCADPGCLSAPYPCFISVISWFRACACRASSATACAASPMAWAVWLDISLTCVMEWLISSLAADCSSLAVAIAPT